ncbi:Sister chromatid cohesion protein PDS5 homolog C-like protein [Drosera capensis]
MPAAASEKELEEELMEAGNRLLKSPPSDKDELLTLLDSIDARLSRVEQSPPESLQNALAPLMKALVADFLLRHVDEDVKVAVAACISEITRITAPEAPYDDERMKDIFKLIVSSFEKLHDKPSRSYGKRAAILETVAKVRSCVLMLDLECDELILEMFNLFFKTIRENHPESVFSSMETIMALVLEESEEISPELINTILSSLEKDKDVLPISQKLGEKVLEICASKLKPLLVQTMELLGKSIDNYNKVVANVCRMTAVEELNSVNGASRNSIADQVAELTPTEKIHSEEVPAATLSSPKAIVSNGSMEKEVDASPDKKDSSHAAENVSENDPQTKMEIEPMKVVESKAGSLPKSQSMPNPAKTSKKRARKQKSSTSPSEPSELHVDDDKEENLSDHAEDKSNSYSPSDHDESAANATMPSENQNESSIPVTTPTVSRNHDLDGPTPSSSQTLPVESQLKRGRGRPRKKVNLIPTPSVTSDSREVTEKVVVSETETHKQAGPEAQMAEERSPSPAECPYREGNTNNVVTNSAEHAVKKDEDVASKLEDTKKRGRGRPRKYPPGTPTTNNEKKPISSPKTSPKTSPKVNNEESEVGKAAIMNFKRKRTPVMLKTVLQADDLLADDLVGSRVRVWWPDDQEFYKGVISEFNPEKKQHKVTYEDGDVEDLVLKDEKWELIDDKIMTPKGQLRKVGSPGASSEMHKNKKAKPNPESTPKRGRPSKGKSTPSSSGPKQMGDDKSDTKSKDASLGDEKGGKSKDAKGGRKYADNVSKSMEKIKDTITSGITNKSKATSSKEKVDDGKNQVESQKARDAGKVTQSSLKGKEEDVVKSADEPAKASELVKEKSPSSSKGKEDDAKNESMEAPDSGKGKSSSSSKGKQSGTKSGRKRPRGS